jgi:hypothetical protein
MGDFYPVNPSSKNGTVNNVAIATTSTAVASSAFSSQTYQVRIAATGACFYKVDASPTAAVTDALLPANWVEYVKVTPGQKVSVFSATIQTVSVVEIVQ